MKLVLALGLVLAASPASALPPVSTSLTTLTVSATTGEKPQSKVWTYDGRWWCVMPNASGTWVWRLDGTAWTNVLQLSSSTATHADVKTVGGVSHILLYNGGSSQLASIEYVPGPQTYQMWTTRPANVALPLAAGTETASLDVDSQGRMWVASDFAAGTSQIVAYYSDAPYSSWSAPVTLATGITDDDIAVVTAMPDGQVAVLWSNQNTRRFGFRRHVDGADPAVWSADEVPASQSALNVGLGMADDHLNVKVASDGTLYAAVKTSYDTGGFPKIALLIRRPAGTWDNLYEIDQSGTRGIVLLDETVGKVTVLYTSVEGSGNILYKESSTAAISFGASSVLIPGGLNDVTSTKQNLQGAVVILAGSGSSLSGRLLTTPVSSYTITASAGSGGTITPSGAVAVGSGASQGFAIAASAGYTIADVVVDGSSVGAVASYTFNNVTANHTIAASFAIDPQASGLVGRWRMDEGSGSTVADDSPNGLNGTAMGSPAWVAGVDGPFALSFTNGSSQSVQVANAAALNFTSAITLAAWIRPTQTATASILNKATFNTVPAVFGYELNLSTTGVPFVRLFNDTQAAGGGRLNASVPYPTNGTTWMHVAATYDGATIKMYINGVLDVTRASSAPLTTNTLPFVIGAPSDGMASRVFPGAIDDARLYNRALTGAEIATLAHLSPTYTITASAGSGGTITPSGAVVVNSGASQGFVIAANAGSHIADVLVDGSSVGPVANYTFTNVTAAHTIAASFAPNVLTITASAGSGGSISPNGAVAVNYGANQAFTIAADPCHATADVLVDGSSVGPVANYTFTNVTAPHTIAASFVLQSFTITASAGPNGAISPSGAQVVTCGANQAFAITANAGYHIADVVVDGGSIGAVASHTFTNVQGPHTISASFAQDVLPGDLVGWWPFEEGSGTAIIDASGNGNHGTLPGGASWAPGMVGLALGLDGSSQRGTVPDSPTLDISGAITMATWVKPQRMATQHLIHKGNNGAQDGYEISLATAPTGSNGKPFVRFNQATNGNTYRLNGTQLYPFDGNTWFHFAATYDGATIKLYINGVLDSSRAETFTIATNNQPLGIGSESDGQFTLQGSMDEARVYGRALSAAEIATLAGVAPTGHTITASAGGGGTIAPSGAVGVNDGADATFTITPATCFTIANVMVDGSSLGPVASYTFTNVTADHTIAASFTTTPPYTITASAGAGGSISPSGAVPADCGGDKTFSIAGDPGYVIADVVVDGNSVGAVASYTFTNVQAGHSISASFATPPDNIAAVPGAGTGISPVTPCLTVPVVFTRNDATPVRGYSVTFELSPNLVLCGAQIVSAGYPLAPRNFQVVSQPGNRWTVDEVTLGFPCGVTGSATIFNVSVSSPATSGTGTITVVSALARDCTNGPVPVVPGPPASITISGGTVAVGDLPFRTQFAPARPTPFGASTTLQFELAKTERIQLAVYAVNGRRIRLLAHGPQDVGVHRITWDGADDQGNRTKAGVYFARLTTDEGQFTQTLVLVE